MSRFFEPGDYRREGHVIFVNRSRAGITFRWGYVPISVGWDYPVAYHMKGSDTLFVHSAGGIRLADLPVGYVEADENLTIIAVPPAELDYLSAFGLADYTAAKIRGEL